MVRPDDFTSAKLPSEAETYIDLQLNMGLLKFRLPDKYYKYKDLIIREYKSVGWSGVHIKNLVSGERKVDEYWQIEFVEWLWFRISLSGKIPHL